MGMLSDIGDAIGGAVTGPGGSRRDGPGNARLGVGNGYWKNLKKKAKTSGTTGDPDNPTLDEIREGVYEPPPPTGQIAEGQRRRRRTVMDLGGRFDQLKTLLGG